jgi:hypothetical protein
MAAILSARKDSKVIEGVWNSIFGIARMIADLSESPVARPPLDVHAVPQTAQFVEEVCGTIL